MNEMEKSRYITECEKGTIIAFDAGDKVRSAKVIKRSSKEQIFKCVTSYGREYLVKFDDILWVKTGSRWPKGVYNKLKGMEENEKQS